MNTIVIYCVLHFDAILVQVSQVCRISKIIKMFSSNDFFGGHLFYLFIVIIIFYFLFSCQFLMFAFGGPLFCLFF